MLDPLSLAFGLLGGGGATQSTSVTSQNSNNIGVNTAGTVNVGGSVNPNANGTITADPSATSTSVAASTKPDQQGFLKGLNLGGTPNYAGVGALPSVPKSNFLQGNVVLIAGVVVAGLGYYMMKG